MQYISTKYSYISNSIHSACDIYHQARQKRLPFPLSNNNACSPFDLIHIDIWGPLSTGLVHGFKYFLTILDGHSRHVWVMMLKSKSEVGLR